MSFDYQFLAINLRRYRGDARLSQAYVAAAAGLRQQYLSSLECGYRPSDRAHVSKLAAVLGVSEEDLLRRVRRIGSRVAA